MKMKFWTMRAWKLGELRHRLKLKVVPLASAGVCGIGPSRYQERTREYETTARNIARWTICPFQEDLKLGAHCLMIVISEEGGYNGCFYPCRPGDPKNGNWWTFNICTINRSGCLRTYIKSPLEWVKRGRPHSSSQKRWHKKARVMRGN